MDFVSAHGGAIPSVAMGVRSLGDENTLDQFHHPLVVRAKLDIASACHAYGKVPSHCVVTEFRDLARLQSAARMASQTLGYTRMWSIHPDQIRPILAAFAPDPAEIEAAATVLERAAAQDWAPISLAGTLHDRASYRYFWHVLERAHQTGCTVPDTMQAYFSPIVH
jgi:citrate lyase subunit beta/citryl-CoA lyase